MSDPSSHSATLDQKARIGILIVAFLGWFFGGVQIGMTSLVFLVGMIAILFAPDTSKRNMSE